MAVLLILPYLIIATVAVLNRKLAVVIAGCLLAVIAVALFALPTAWNDHQAWQREAPGREVQHYGLLAVLFVQWVGSGMLVILVVGYRLISISLKRKDQTK
jgi:hypothetical protein